MIVGMAVLVMVISIDASTMTSMRAAVTYRRSSRRAVGAESAWGRTGAGAAGGAAAGPGRAASAGGSHAGAAVAAGIAVAESVFMNGHNRAESHGFPNDPQH